jgi:hypothetical protein
METMRRRVILISFSVALTSVLIAGAAMAAEGPRFLIATGQEFTANIPDPGAATCIGGVATGNPYDPCHGSHRVLLRHQVVQTMLMPDPAPVGDAVPLLAGMATITIDCSLDGALKGNCWGTFEWNVDDDSTWAGVVSGTFDYGTFVLVYQLIGRGFGGSVDGMQLHYDVSYDGGYDFVGDFAARIHAPKQ